MMSARVRVFSVAPSAAVVELSNKGASIVSLGDVKVVVKALKWLHWHFI